MIYILTKGSELSEFLCLLQDKVTPTRHHLSTSQSTLQSCCNHDGKNKSVNFKDSHYTAAIVQVKPPTWDKEYFISFEKRS